MKQRSIVLNENKMPIIRHDVEFNGNDNLEKDLANFIARLENKGMIDKNKLIKYIKKDFTLLDCIRFMSDKNNRDIFNIEFAKISKDALKEAIQ